MASEKAGVDLESDNGAAAFKELEALKPNVVKTYSKSSDLANMFSSVQARAAKALSESPVNTKVELTDEEAKNLTYGSVVDNAKVLNFEYINSQMSTWLDTWNRIMN